jgi:hypothetical protein
MTMSLELFAFALLLTAGTVGAALFYLRGVTRRVLLALCQRDEAADFWLRSADVLALAGSGVLVLAFGGLQPEANWVQQVRLVLGLAMAGVFVTVVLVARSVWRAVPALAAASTGSRPSPASFDSRAASTVS